ncbi:hypothetical protein Tco_0888154 [Tanacetum coccineum]
MTAEGANKPEAQWLNDERRVDFQENSNDEVDERTNGKSFDDEELVQVKVLMALADDELAMGKNHARNGEWIGITVRKGASPSSEVMPLTYLEHYPRERPGLRVVEHTNPDIQDFASDQTCEDLGRGVSCVDALVFVLSWFDIRALPYSIYRGPLNSFDVRVISSAVGYEKVDIVVLEVYTKSKKEHESHLKLNLELLKKRYVLEAQQGLKPDGRRDDGWSYLWVVIARPSTMWERANVVVDAWSRKGGVKPRRILMVGDVRTLIMEEAHATKYSVRPGNDGSDVEVLQTWELCLELGIVRNLVVLGILTFREVEIGEISPWKGVVRFDKKGELAPRYIGPFEILERIDPIAYRLRLPDELTIRIFVWVSKFISSKIPIVKVSWNSKRNFKLTWVWEDYLKDKYLDELFGIVRVESFWIKSQDEIS